MERETVHKSQDVPISIETHFTEGVYDYVEYLGDFMKYKVYRARFFDDDVFTPFITILAKGYKFRKCRPGYEMHIVYDYLEKGICNFSMWHLLSIRIRLFIDKVFCYIMALLIPDHNYGLLKKIKIISSKIRELY